MGGRIETITVDKGDAIEMEQPLLQLDTSLIDAEISQAEAEISLAQAQLAQLKAGAPEAEVAVVAATIPLAQAQQAAAQQAWQDAILLRDNPQELNAQIDAVYSQIEMLELQMEQAAYIREAAELGEGLGEEFWATTQKGIDWSFTIPGIGKKSGHYSFLEGDKQQASVEWNLASMQVWETWVDWENAKNSRNSAQSALHTLLDLRDNPLEAEIKVTQVGAEYEAKTVAVDVAKSNLNLIKAGPADEQIALLESQVSQSESRLETLKTQREKQTLLSPIAGTVMERVAHKGEVAVPGAALLTVARPEKVTLTVYVPESDYGRLRQNQKVEVYVDSYPDEPFPGSITAIGSEAEFTPKNVQTKEERVSTVYAIKVTLPNDDGRLKPGMPADAVFVEAIK
ncbi:MAG: hypothetical protein B6243_13820 [Anaerolineaceae bacterium 4572_5.2]|nr:MAG: hypothetical protein B6243_13820 [Anaerolineaceae bacterium 4572_5.2]